MGVERPYRRTCRQFIDGRYAEGGRWEYMIHSMYAQTPENYVRAFLIFLKDLEDLFDYVEPAEKNLPCYSYRIHALLLRACVELEANCKAILKENEYGKAGSWDMRDYRKIDKTHLLSKYEVKVPNWNGNGAIRTPFDNWQSGGALPWYDAYNATKHDRHDEFQEATFEHLIDASCGLLVILSAQFRTNDFSPGGSFLVDASRDGLETGIGGYFRVRFPEDWPEHLRYDFDWQKLKHETDPFRTIDYSKIP